MPATTSASTSATTPIVTHYVTLAEMNGLIPAQFLVQALDDNNDGIADSTAWTDVLGAVQREIDGIVGIRYAVPFRNPIPAIITHAAQIFAAEMLYNRRGFSGEERNPWTSQAKQIRARLESVAQGKLPLTPDTKREKPSVSIVGEQAKTTSLAGKLAV
ncbi:phage protein Gp36 family protein [Geminisphaera colitermitum]|uniref:phage protein Gp36 family protein n=1 Tax=Geminisphaera colitermitum TaxID=1148786 RepID=UPI0005BBFD95|nr:phage protein Gp36 family protein [Geminisphaera colitermitum]